MKGRQERYEAWLAAKKGLTDKMVSFVTEYTIDCNATQAYHRSTYTATTDNSAAVQAHRLLRNPKIQAAIDARMEWLAVGKDEAVARMARLSRSSYEGMLREVKIGEGEDASSYLVPSLAEAKKNGRLDLVKSYEVTERYTQKGELVVTTKMAIHDKMAATDKILRIHGLYKDNVTVRTSPYEGLSDDQLKEERSRVDDIAKDYEEDE